MIINLGDAPFKAFIKVTYKTGTCTCTNGKKTYTHSGGGTATFEVNAKGAWTVKAVSGSYSASQNVTIGRMNETQSVTLKYELILWAPGNNNTSVTGGWYGDIGVGLNANTGGHVIINNTTFRLGGTEKNAACLTVNQLNFSQLKNTFSKLCVTMSYSAQGKYVYWGLTNDKAYPYQHKFNIASGPVNSGTVSLNISNITGQYWLGFYSSVDDVLSISKIWFEG